MEKLLKKLNENMMSYRPIPFWSWNDKLEPEELKKQKKALLRQSLFPLPLSDSPLLMLPRYVSPDIVSDGIAGIGNMTAVADIIVTPHFKVPGYRRYAANWSSEN